MAGIGDDRGLNLTRRRLFAGSFLPSLTLDSVGVQLLHHERECPAMVVGVLRLTLFLPENHSLKGKRQVLRAIKDRVRNKFNVSITESDGHDMWQRAELGICQVGSDRAFVDSALREVVNFIDSLGLAPLGEEQLEILNY
jgi:uncharacterized protein YlxP (DUF503 family)